MNLQNNINPLGGEGSTNSNLVNLNSPEEAKPQGEQHDRVENVWELDWSNTFSHPESWWNTALRENEKSTQTDDFADAIMR